jgi:3-oxoacyl-[acyl-carrier-protein] synthase-1
MTGDPLAIVSCGAVTAVGLSAAQSCAAIRARVAAFKREACLPPPVPPLAVARVPAVLRLKRTPAEWLLNLAELALRDCLGPVRAPRRRVALVLALPDAHREHPALRKAPPARFLQQLLARLQLPADGPSAVLQEGHAAGLRSVAIARELLASGEVDACIVGGVDSLLESTDLQRLSAAGRLHEAANPQGVVPGEGAAFVVLQRGSALQEPALAQVLGLGAAMEADTILGERFSVGAGLLAAMRGALADAGVGEPSLGFRVSDLNGERYRAWEALLASTRFYRTRREHMPVWQAAACVGDTGAAAGALMLVTAAVGFSRGYAPAPLAMCEASSDSGLRAACVLAAAGPALPPFRTRTAWT